MGIARKSLKLSAFLHQHRNAVRRLGLDRQRAPILGMKYYTGFFIEKALSIDNVFVISLIFTFFAIPVQIPVPRACSVGHHWPSSCCAG
jgi:tellurite resistance protein TerC